MIDIPKDIKDKICDFRTVAVPGSVFYCKNYKFPDNSQKNKYILILKSCDFNNNSVFFLPTSQLDKFQEIPYLLRQLYIFSEDKVPEFRKETAICIRDLKRQPYHILERRFLANDNSIKLEYRFQIPKECLLEIYKRIKNSQDLSEFQKKCAIPEDIIDTLE
ncbi:MAG: hypothetical protein R3F48_16740 [Candidatus Zixiibacteriota bacterium]